MRYISFIIPFALMVLFDLTCCANQIKSLVSNRHMSYLENQEQGISAKSYVRNGLVALYDGIENVRYGKHSDTTDVWVNLADGAPIEIGANEVGFDYVRCTSGIKLPREIYTLIRSETEWHIEAVFCPNTIANGGSGPYYFHYQVVNTGWSNRGMAILGFFNGNYSIDWVLGEIGTICSQNKNIGNTFYAIGFSNGIRATDEIEWTSKNRNCIDGYIGRGYENNGDVTIYCFRLYDRALTDDEVFYNYQIDCERFGL